MLLKSGNVDIEVYIAYMEYILVYQGYYLCI